MRISLPLLWSILLLMTAAGFIAALASGSVALPWAEVVNALLGRGEGVARSLVIELRLPRAAAAFVTGGLLALAGALMQVLLRNPLADPYILGVSGGAAVAALLTLLLGLGGQWLTLGAAAGALLSVWLVFGLARGQGSWNGTRLLLTGAVISAGWGALISLILAIAPERNVKGMLFWLMGDLSQANLPWTGVGLLVAGLVLALFLARDLNILARGEVQAAALGVSTGRIRVTVYFLGSLLTAAAVTIAGSVGFVGLVVPHLLRLIVGSDHRLLLPASVLAGGSLLLIADTLARTVIAPQQLPVGVITALIGVPVFLFLLQRGYRKP